MLSWQEALFIGYRLCPRASEEKFLWEERGATKKKNRKITKKIQKSSTIKPLPGRATEKRPKNCKKKNRKIALLSLYLLYLYHV